MSAHSRLGCVVVAWALLAPSAHAQVSAPITEWQIPTCGAFSELVGPRVDRQGAVWLACDAFISTVIAGVEIQFTSPAIIRLTPRRDAFRVWPVGGVSNLGVDVISAIAPAADGTVFFTTGARGLGRLDPATNAVTWWVLSEHHGDVAVDNSDPQHPILWTTGSFEIPSPPGIQGNNLASQVTRFNPETGRADSYTWPRPIPGFPDPTSGPPASTILVGPDGAIWIGAGGDKFLEQMHLDPDSGELLRWVSAGSGIPNTHGELFSTRGCVGEIERFVPATGVITTWEQPVPPLDICGLDVGARVYYTRPIGNDVGRLDPSYPPTDSRVAAPPIVLSPAQSWAIVDPSADSAAPFDYVTARTTTLATSSIVGAFEDFPAPTAQGSPNGIAINACNVFFIENAASKVGRLKTSAEEPVQDVKNAVNGFVGSHVLTIGQGRSLSRTLDLAVWAFNHDELRVMRVVLGVFVIETNGLVRAGVLTPSQGDLLTTPVSAIVSGCTIID